MGYVKRREIEALEPREEPPMEVLGWIPVSERLPVDIPHGYCLVTDGTNVGTAHWSNSGNCFDHCSDRDYWKPTHWMPLPEPPEVK